jgi:transglutaminase-like putative cysteine protease
MRLDLCFRISTYLTLAMASLCLGYAEAAFLPAIVIFGAAMGVVLLTAFCVEGRWALSMLAANLLGFAIAAGSAVWIAWYFIHPPAAVAETTGAATAVLPYLGPVVMILMLAKLFRPKQVHDYWLLHSIGLLQVVLACVLASDATFGLCLLGYVACFLWSLSLFHLYRGQRAMQESQSAPGRKLLGLAERPRSPWKLLGTVQAGGWTAVIVLGGLVIFLCTPQHGELHWDPLKALKGPDPATMTTGFAEGIDLNLTGNLETNDAVVIEVSAEDNDHRPKLDLGQEQRWRGMTLDDYDKGRWYNDYYHDFLNIGHPQGDPPLPDLGPDQYTLTLTVDTRQVKQLFLAEPVIVDPGSKVVPVEFVKDPRKPDVGRKWQWLRQSGDEYLWPKPPLQGRKHRYKQRVAAVPQPDLHPPLHTTRDYEERLRHQPVPEVAEETRRILGRLVEQGKLARRHIELLPRANVIRRELEQILQKRPPRRRDVPNMVLAREHQEQVARALSEYLAFAGEYKYSLSLERRDTTLDPTADFLRNVKQGSCEPFAGALALMLRSQGIPTRVVVGFRGQDSQGNGEYVVRQSHAHSWVEALIWRADGRGDWEQSWLTLDPTPVLEAGATSGDRWAWLLRGRSLAQVFWANYILNYNAGQQADAVAALGGLVLAARRTHWAYVMGRSPFLSLQWWLRAVAELAVVVVAVVGLVLLRRRLRWRWNRRQRPAPGTGFYRDLLAVLARYCRLAPAPSQTPLEFGAVAAEALQARTGNAALAQVPGQIAVLFYRVRYGHRSLSPGEQAEVDGQIADLAGTLRALK